MKRSELSRHRQASAKQLFELNNKKRNVEALRQIERETVISQLKKKEWEAKFYSSLAKRKNSNTIQDMKGDLESRRLKLKHLLSTDNWHLEIDREQKSQCFSSVKNSEIELLKIQLKNLKNQNELERKKLCERLKYEVWRKNNHSNDRQDERDRLNNFVCESWIDKNIWKAEDKKLIEKNEEKKKVEAIKKEEEEKVKRDKCKEERENYIRLWKKELDDNLNNIGNQTKLEDELLKTEEILENHKTILEQLKRQRNAILEERKQKYFNKLWSHKHQAKLKACAKMVISHLENDLKFANTITESAVNSDKAMSPELEEIVDVINNHKQNKLHIEKQLEFIFSDECRRLMESCEMQWNKEQKERDELFQNILNKHHNHITEKLVETSKAREWNSQSKISTLQQIENLQTKIEESERKNDTGAIVEDSENLTKEVDRKWSSDIQALKRQLLFQENSEGKLEKEIARLEREMASLFQSGCVPPTHGRKRAEW